jgi:uncharacterized protein (DUF885 family)
MLKEAGYFGDGHRTREIVDDFMRLRALRVEVDMRLALRTFTIDEAAEYLERTVPIDRGTAREEAASSASPGRAISYRIGKLQIVRLLSHARRVQGVPVARLPRLRLEERERAALAPTLGVPRTEGRDRPRLESLC